MPATAIINLRALSGGRMPRSFHCLMHPLFLDRIRAAAPSLATALHDSGAMAPFSISPVMGKKRDGAIISNESYWVRICLLDDALEDVFFSTLEKGLWQEPLHFGDLRLLVEDVVVGKQNGNLWSGRDPYETLAKSAQPFSKARVHFVSPVSFKRGDLHYPFPEPALLFSNLLKRWNQFSETKLPAKKETSDVSVSFFDLKTTPYALRNGGTIVGAVGDCTFVFNGSDEDKRYYNTLLRFAFYSGVGVKTTQGMGMCRLIDNKADADIADR